MKNIIKSPVRINGVVVTIIPNFQGVRGLYQYCGGYRNNGHPNYSEKWAITIQDMVGWNGLTELEINEILEKVFGDKVTFAKIKAKSYITYSSENNSYFAAVLKVKKLKELI